MIVNKKNIAIVAVIIIVLLISSLMVGSFGQFTGSVASSGDGEFATRSYDNSFSAITPESASSYMELGLTDQQIVAYDEVAKEQYIIKTGDLNIVVENLESAIEQLSELANVYGGSVTNRYVYSYEDAEEATVDLTVDQKQFEPALKAIKELSTRVNSENVNADDVTETVVDIQARLENAQAEEQAYLDIMTKATKVEDILNVQYYLSNVRATIESYQAQLEYYENHTSQSTITVYLSEATSIVLDSETFQPWQTIKDSVQTVIRMFQNLVLYVIEVIIVGGAILVPVAILYFGGRFIYRRYKK